MRTTAMVDGARRRVLIVDRHRLMRHAAAGWIQRCPEFEVCGQAGGVASALRAVKQFHPDVVLSEILRPHDLGFIRELHRRHPRIPILVFSIQDATEYEAQARAAGASGYLTKAAGGTKLVQHLRAVLRGTAGRPVATSRSARAGAASALSRVSAAKC